MKRFISSNILLLSLTLSTFGSSPETITILEKGVKRQIAVPPINSTTEQSINQTTSENSQSGIVLVFKDLSKLSLSDFEIKYGLKLKTKMAIGYYIFENLSSKTDSEIVAEIITNERNIKTVKPNWKMHNTIR